MYAAEPEATVMYERTADVIAVVEKERTDEADVGGGMRRSEIDASSKETAAWGTDVRFP